MRFTDRSISSLKAKSARYEIWEDGRTGLGVRISPHGRKSWVFMYRFQGLARRMTFGAYPTVGLADAKLAHAEASKRLHAGIDPGAELVAKRRGIRTAETIKELVDLYLEKHARPNKKSADADERALMKDVVPAWGRRKANSIKRREIIAMIDRIVSRGSPVQANRTLSVVRKLFNFGIERDILDATPCVMVKPPTKEKPRDRVLSDMEIPKFWNGLATAKMTDILKLALKFALVTGQRREEVISAAWGEFDLPEKVWELPSERTKNGRGHRVPLSPLALELLADIKKENPKNPWLFPTRSKDQPIKALAVSHAVRKNIDVFGLERFTPHDLRRSAASGMTKLGFNRLVVSKILNHTDPSVTAIYDRYEYDHEKRRALDAWGARLQEIISGQEAASNVVELSHG